MNFEKNRGTSPERGRIYQRVVLGEAKIDPAFFEAVDQLPKDGRGHARREDVFDLFKKHYDKKEAVDPTQRILGDLRHAIIAALSSKGQVSRAADLSIFSTIDTPIDVWYGTDAFLEYKDQMTGKTVRLTIDVTLDTEKLTTGGKADILLGELPDAVQEAEAYTAELRRYAQQIAIRIKDLAEPGWERNEIKQKPASPHEDKRKGRRIVISP